MASNIFGRYVWLVDILLKYNSLTYDEINHLWHMSGLNHEKNEDLPKRTFYNHRKAVEEIFGINIECDIKNGNRYYIYNVEDLQQNELRRWLLDSYSTLNQIECDRNLKGRIIFEKVPSAHTWLHSITEAMRRNEVLYITYKKFGDTECHYYEIEPYCLKIFKRRWYLIGRNATYAQEKSQSSNEDFFRTYSLDRIREIVHTGKHFMYDQDFDIGQYLEGCCGIFRGEGDVEKIVIEAYGKFPEYLRSLPLHESQVEVETKADSAIFEYEMKPTFDFYQYILTQGKQLKVLQPQSIRDELRAYAQALLDYYS